MLVHNPVERPSAKELSESPDLPPPQLDSADFDQYLNYILSTNKSFRGTPDEYYRLMRKCLGQTSSERHISNWLSDNYNKTCSRFKFNKSFSLKHSPNFQSPCICDVFIKRCLEMGAQYFQVFIYIFFLMNTNS